MIKKYFIVIILSFFIFSPVLANAATLSISPASGTFEVGERVIVKVLVSSNDVQFNAVSSTILFPSSIFSIESVSKTNSILNFWATEPVFSKDSNTVKFEGISLGGFQGFTGTVVTVALRAVNVGSGLVSFKSGQILANDGQGTDITGSLVGASFTVKEALTKNLPPKENIEKEIDKITEPTSQPKPSLKAPEIMLSTKYGAPAIIGVSDYPKSQVLTTFISQNGAKIFITGTADSDGGFNLLVPNSLKRGSYDATAVMIKEDNTNSESSNKIVVKVGDIFSDITWEIQLLIFLLVLLIIYLLLRVYVHFGNTNNTEIKQRVHDAQNVVDKSFDILREDVAEYSGRELTSTERKHLSDIKKDISDAEKIIDKKIKDIEL